MAHDKLRVLEDHPFNAEALAHALDQPLTPVGHFFVRNNGVLPDTVDFQNWTFAIDGEVERPKTWSLDALKTGFERTSVTAVLECAGNGRARFAPPTPGLQWTNGAVGCARWTGVRLGDVLRACGIKDTAVYTAHFSPDTQVNKPESAALSRGLPVERAVAPETLLAFEMNGRPLPREHGGPLRVIAPGFPGSAWQKWIERIWVRDREHDGAKMTGTDYRLPQHPVSPGGRIDPTDFKVITEMPVKSLITSPADGFVIPAAAPVEIRGFAWTGQGDVSSVAVSIDGGGSWHDATLEPAEGRYAWHRFTMTVRPERAGRLTVLARASDSSGRTQPLAGTTWNPNGYCNNDIHSISGTVA
jgi:DMSO/TMAO reductase YedYZ molybdopterin-dependent catalytic subunit